MSLVLSSPVLLFLGWFIHLFSTFWEIFLCTFSPEIHIVSGCRRSYFEEKPFYLALLPSMFFHGTEPSSSLPSSTLWEEETHDEKQKGRHFRTVILKLKEALLKSCGKPPAIIHILSESGIGSLQTDWHLGASPATWMRGISMLQHGALLQLMVDHKENLCKNPAGGTVEDKGPFLGASLCYSHRWKTRNLEPRSVLCYNWVRLREKHLGSKSVPW